MFCPYLRKEYIRFTGISYNRDMLEDGSIIYEQYINKECKKEKCGAYYNGRCNYNG